MPELALRPRADLGAARRPSADGAADLLPYGRQTIEADDIAAVASALTADLLTTGPLVERFEAALASATGATHAVACANGTAALHLALVAAGLQPGEACVVPAITFLATANSVAFLGGRVVFADVDPETGLMTPECLAEALARAGGGRVRAVLPVHLRGDPADMPAIEAIARAHGALVIEDACHALGTLTPWGPAGANAHASMTCFSFHPVKTITTGEGGAVTARNPELDSKLRRARNHGLERRPHQFRLVEEAFSGDEPNPWWYEQHELGWNYRLPDLNCALGLSQLAKLDRFAARRRALTALYRGRLAGLQPWVRAIPSPDGVSACPHLMSVLIDFDGLGLSRKAVVEGLRARGVGTQVHYIPVHWQPYWRSRSGPLQLAGAEAYYRRTLSLPLFPSMADADVERVVAALEEVLTHES